MRDLGALLALVAVLAAGCGGEPGSRDGRGETSPTASTSGDSGSPSTSGGAPTPSTSDVVPLAGKVVVLDPGHQLGNRLFASEISRRVDAGGFDKACNTTGTSTDSGYPEATFTWDVTVATKALLERLGARVVLTRASNSDDLWGPCVDERGSVGNPGEPGPDADVRVSIHADGALEDGASGFHVIRPGDRAGWTDDVAGPSRRLAVLMRDALVDAGFTPSTYRGRRGIDVRTDLGTLNHSDVPVVMAELGNMRDAREAAVMESARGRERYARAIVGALRAFLTG